MFMLEQQDLNVLKSMMQEVVQESEQNIAQKIDEKITYSENLILKELDRVQEHLENDIDKVHKNLDELKQYYRIDKLESENTTLLLKMYNDMQKEISEIKSRIA